jgi:thioesterase domain-containing protein
VHQQGGNRVPPLVLLKPGNCDPPIFMAHGLGGNVMEVFPLATRLDVGHSIYGMQARGIDGLEEPHERIEDMAEYHLDAIRQLQPHGPYFLTGYSFGGLEMLEVARRLSRAGEKIALLAMLDSYPHRHSLSFGQHARLALHLAKRRATSLMRGGRNDDRIPAGRRSEGDAAPQPLPGELDARAVRVSEHTKHAWRDYRPQFYEGKIRFVKAAVRSYFPADPVAVWGPLVRECTLESVPCDHKGLLTTHIETVTAIVSRYVKEALGEK